MQGLHETWGKNVRERRTALGLTQVALAEIVGCRQATLSKLESGGLCPRDDLKWRLAGALGLTVQALFPYPGIVPPFPDPKAA